ncbi:hypothetical protein theurythT_18680 [Thalassotalea eurytherma]|uniref:IS110 family transposase n=1 Tax=Thalassotalea eurytherma TaxID=1144278 RepID=A0ABQ6H7J7_9GAMM|nr:hypothetical protein theurythT_18680 [Thalassotalea eurytherma]
MSLIKVLCIDLGKSSFHAIGRDHTGREQLKRKFTRSKLFCFLSNLPKVIVAMESCGGSH